MPSAEKRMALLIIEYLNLNDLPIVKIRGNFVRFNISGALSMASRGCDYTAS